VVKRSYDEKNNIRRGMNFYEYGLCPWTTKLNEIQSTLKRSTKSKNKIKGLIKTVNLKHNLCICTTLSKRCLEFNNSDT